MNKTLGPNAACAEGGGDGRRWLWSEYIDTTSLPSTWLMSAVDNKQCGTLESPRLCDISDHCSNVKLPQGWNYDLDRGIDHAMASLEKANQTCTNVPGCIFVKDRLCQFSPYRCVPSLDPSDKKYHEGILDNSQQMNLLNVKWQQALKPYRGNDYGEMHAQQHGGSQAEIRKAYRTTGDICISYATLGGKLPVTKVRW